MPVISVDHLKVFIQRVEMRTWLFNPQQLLPHSLPPSTPAPPPFLLAWSPRRVSRSRTRQLAIQYAAVTPQMRAGVALLP